MSQYPVSLPMWLLPGVQFLRHICLLHFTNHIENSLFSEFYHNLQLTMGYLKNSTRSNSPTLSHIRSKPSSQVSLIAKQKANRARKNKMRYTRIEQLERMDRRIDRRRADDGLIGHIKLLNKPSFISKKVEDDLASLKIRNFHKINLLARGQFATSKKHPFFVLFSFVRLFEQKKKRSALPGSNCGIVHMFANTKQRCKAITSYRGWLYSWMISDDFLLRREAL